MKILISYGFSQSSSLSYVKFGFRIKIQYSVFGIRYSVFRISYFGLHDSKMMIAIEYRRLLIGKCFFFGGNGVNGIQRV